ncbi:MAG: nitrilase family protein, partial [Alphaproteobacteria bacterium]|nr:nitrilase family protein [Alphaproteobacteria bacterium]
MTITLLQRDIIWSNPDINRKRAEKAILEAPLSDLYVLPEMWSTGFLTEPKNMAEKEPSESLQWMHKMADKLDAAVTGSIATQTKDGIYCNRLYFVKPHQAEEYFYDKHHLFS